MQIFTDQQVQSFRTARFSERAHAAQGGLPIERVRIEFFGGAFNAFYRRNECLFHCYASDDKRSLISTYYQNALIHFME